MIAQTKILYHYLRTKQMQKRLANRQWMEHWQEKHVKKHLRFVRKHSPFYRSYWQDYDDKDWRNFPIIDKSMMMEHFDALNTVGITKEQAFEVAYEAERSRNFSPMIDSITVGLSSGTSGNRGIFLVSPHERNAWAGTILAKMLPKSLFHQEKISFFLRADSNLYRSVRSNTIHFEFYDLLHPLVQHIERLNEQRPGILVAPPSMLRMLAEAKQSGHLLIHPHKIISVAEVLDPLDRTVIESQFQQTVHQIYQCTEGFLACTCPYGTLHLNEDIVIVEKEYVDRHSGRFVPIITDFSRKAQPIIRYRLNDILIERNTPCPCGSPFQALEAVEGRCDDVFYFPSLEGNDLRPVFPDFISRTIMYASDEVMEYKVIQQAPNRLDIYLRISARATDAKRIQQRIGEKIRALCGKVGCQVPDITFQPWLEHTDHRLKKMRRVERNFSLTG